MRLVDRRPRKREPLFAVRYGNALVAEQKATSSASAAVRQAEQRELAREEQPGQKT